MAQWAVRWCPNRKAGIPSGEVKAGPQRQHFGRVHGQAHGICLPNQAVKVLMQLAWRAQKVSLYRSCHSTRGKGPHKYPAPPPSEGSRCTRILSLHPSLGGDAMVATVCHVEHSMNPTIEPQRGTVCVWIAGFSWSWSSGPPVSQVFPPHGTHEHMAHGTPISASNFR